jgi:hypothetical protein
MNHCPVCGQRSIGKVGTGQYFCWDCCVEFTVKDNDIKVFDVQADGSLLLADDYVLEQPVILHQEGVT